MWTPAHTYLHTNRFVHTENAFWSALQNAGKCSSLSATASEILVATFTLLALLPHSFYFHSIVRDRLNLRLADPKLMTFRSPLYVSFGCSQFKNFSVPDFRDNQCDESLLHEIRTTVLGFSVHVCSSSQFCGRLSFPYEYRPH